MILYLVRHGESALRADGVQKHQDGKVELSPHGKKQASSVAERFVHLPVDVIIASPLERAKQTAEEIGKKIDKPIELSSLIEEIKRPTEIEGREKNDPEVIAIRNKILENWHDQTWQHSDEESFFTFRNRAIKALAYAVSLKKEHVLFVTHGEFMMMLMMVMARGDEVQPDEFKSFRRYLSIDNTGLTICEYKADNWKLITWNDHIHLGE